MLSEGCEGPREEKMTQFGSCDKDEDNAPWCICGWGILIRCAMHMVISVDEERDCIHFMLSSASDDDPGVRSLSCH
jgi:hypothetical protein